MADNKKSFVLYASWAVLGDALPEEQAGILFKAICAKQIGKEYQIEDPAVAAVFAMISQKMDEDEEAYERAKAERSEQNRRAAGKRWVKKDADAENPMHDDANACARIKSNADAENPMHDDAIYVSVSGTVSDTGSLTETKRERTPTGSQRESGKRFPVTYQEIAETYNRLCPSLPEVKTLSEARKKAIKARLRKYSPEDLSRAFEMVEQSDFLPGANSRNWTANFDWIMKDTNLAKILDGNYKNSKRQQSGRDSPGDRMDEYLQKVISGEEAI